MSRVPIRSTPRFLALHSDVTCCVWSQVTLALTRHVIDPFPIALKHAITVAKVNYLAVIFCSASEPVVILISQDNSGRDNVILSCSNLLFLTKAQLPRENCYKNINLYLRKLIDSYMYKFRSNFVVQYVKVADLTSD